MGKWKSGKKEKIEKKNWKIEEKMEKKKKIKKEKEKRKEKIKGKKFCCEKKSHIFNHENILQHARIYVINCNILMLTYKACRKYRLFMTCHKCMS